MEGSQWFRLGLIAALFVGSTYVLLPTIFQADPNADKAKEIRDDNQQAEQFEQEFELLVLEGEPEDLAKAVEKRLEAADLKIDGVVVENDRVVVRRYFTVSNQDIIDNIDPAPVVRLHPLQVEFELEDGAEAPTTASAIASRPEVTALAGGAPGSMALDLNVTKAAGSKVTVDAPFADAGPLFLVVDDAVRGVVVPDAPAEDDPDATGVTTGSWAGVGGYTSLAEDLAVTPMPGVLSPIMAQVEAGDDSDGTDDTDSAVVKENPLPAWLLAILPDTRMPLGLDLQGGVDLTLQVAESQYKKTGC